VPVAATTTSGAASTTAQAAATSRGRRPVASAAAHLVRMPGSLDLFIKFPFEPTRLWPQVDIFTRAPTSGNRLPYGFQQKDHHRPKVDFSHFDITRTRPGADAAFML
jgi:hypothetical protein